MPKHLRRHKLVPSNRQGDDIPRWALSFDLSVRYVIRAWLGGVGLALFVAWLGLQDFITGHAVDRYGVVFNGASARVEGIAYIMGGAFCHFFLFWGAHHRLSSYGRKAGYSAAATFLTLWVIARLI